MTATFPESPPTLQQLVRQRLDELDVSARQAARDTKGAISYESISLILRGKHSGNLSEQGANGLAKALRIPVSRVWASVGETEPEPWVWPERFSRLELWQREIVESVAAGFLKSNKQ